MIHQRDERRLAVGLGIRQREVFAEGAVDEFGAGVLVEQDHADVDLVQCGGEPCRSGVALALMFDGIQHFLPQHAGDHRRAGCRDGEQQQARQVRGIETRGVAVMQQEHRCRSDCDDGAHQSRTDPAERGGDANDADLQRRGIGDRKALVSHDRRQRCRCRHDRAEQCTPVDPHGKPLNREEFRHISREVVHGFEQRSRVNANAR